MKRWLTIILCLLVLFLISWFIKPIRYVIIYNLKLGSEIPNGDKPPIQIFGRTFPDLILFGTAFSITFVNNQDMPIENCRFGLEYKYVTSLHQLTRWNPKTRYDFPPTADIPPNSRLTFEFSHDASSGWKFRDEMGEHYQYRWGLPKNITIESSNFPKTSWKLSWKLTKGRRTYLPVKD